MTATATDARHDSDMTLRQNTIASITLEAGSTKRTVQRWLAKCGDIGILRENTRYFSEAEKVQILSHKSNRAVIEEVVEAELLEPGAITFHQGDRITARPLISFDLAPIELSTASLDTSALDAQTQQYQQQAQNGANAIAAALSARFDMGIAQIVAEQNNLLEGIKASALNGAARSILNSQAQPGKPR